MSLYCLFFLFIFDCIWELFSILYAFCMSLVIDFSNTEGFWLLWITNSFERRQCCQFYI